MLSVWIPIISDHIVRRTLDKACRLQSSENSHRLFQLQQTFSDIFSREKYQHQSMIVECEGTLHESLAKLQELLAYQTLALIHEPSVGKYMYEWSSHD